MLWFFYNDTRKSCSIGEATYDEALRHALGLPPQSQTDGRVTLFRQGCDRQHLGRCGIGGIEEVNLDPAGLFGCQIEGH